MDKVLVTGGAGFIGSHVVDELLRKGDKVWAFDNLSSGKAENVCDAAALIKGDIRDSALVEALLEIQPTVVVHCAAQMSVRVSMQDPLQDADINILGLVNLLQGLRLLREQREITPYVVFTSTGGAIYGEQNDFPAYEDHVLNPTSTYGLSKKVGELYLQFWMRSFSIPACVLRLANVYGPRQNPDGEAGVVAIFSKKLLQNETARINGSGEQTRDFVYVKDVARAITTAIEKRANGIYNIGTGKERSINTLYSVIAGAACSSLQPEYGEAKEGEQLRSCISPRLAQQELGWGPTVSFEEGVSETLDWFRTLYNS
jgi:UDP-glucose 4-epimerase